MKKIVSIFLLLSSVVFASPTTDTKSLLACPEAIITIEGPLTTKSKAQVIEKSSIDTDRRVVFQGGLERTEDGTSLGSVSWRHITRTEYGDIYLVVFSVSPEKKEAVSLLFDGTQSASCKRGTWSISIAQP